MFANNFCAASTIPELNAASEKYYAQEKLYNENVMGLAWMNTAAEYRALCYQAYNAVKTQVADAVKNRKRNGKPLAIILDVDETILAGTPYNAAFVGTGKTSDEKN